MSDYGLVMPFIDDSPSFVHGYECGTISSRMEAGKVLDNYLLHVANIEQVRMLARRWHYEVVIEELDDTWATMSGSRTGIN